MQAAVTLAIRLRAGENSAQGHGEFVEAMKAAKAERAFHSAQHAIAVVVLPDNGAFPQQAG